MKTLNFIFTPQEQKELLTKLVLCSFMAVGIYCNSKDFNSNSNPSTNGVNLTNVYNNQYSDFDKTKMPTNSRSVEKMISILRPELPIEYRAQVAELISDALQGTSLNPQIMVSIIDVESLFNQSAVSSTGDLSIAQINPNVWNKEFLRLNLEPLDVERLKVDHAYSLQKMVLILTHLKNKYAKNDRRWYARYHSHSKKYKRIYLSKLDQRMRLLEVKKRHFLLQDDVPNKLIALQ